MSEAASAASSNTVPLDVVFDILERLPAKPFIRLRLISKSLFSMTAGSNFITSHLELSRSSRYASLPSRYLKIFPPRIVMLDEQFMEVLRLEIPFSFSYGSVLKYFNSYNYFLVGFCHGLLCFTDDVMGCLGRVVVLWNPRIGKFKSITDTSLNSEVLRDAKTRIALGLGFDGKENDYKIIRIVVSKSKNEPSPQAEIYSLKTDSWRKVISPIFSESKLFFSESSRCTFVNGALHWVARSPGETNSDYYSVILSFKIDVEQFKVIRLPHDHGRRGKIFSIVLMALEELLAVAILYEAMEDGVMEDRCRVWKMKKEEEKESWTEEIIPITGVSRCHGCTEDGELILSKNGFQVCSYNVETGTLKKTNIAPVEFVVPFRESLVLP